jgi:phosphoribosylglycinamide formyltransferase-1
MKNIILFASGSGTNVEKIIQHFESNLDVNISAIFSNNSNAKVLERAKKHKIYSEIVPKSILESDEFADKIAKLNPDLIVLAGFLLKFPSNIIAKFPDKIINIHPALLPKYGGKGMYGMHVHQAVFENKEKETGITIHYVNEEYDEGVYIFQKTVSIDNCKSAEEIAKNVLELEHHFFPEVIEVLITN